MELESKESVMNKKLDEIMKENRKLEYEIKKIESKNSDIGDVKKNLKIEKFEKK